MHRTLCTPETVYRTLMYQIQYTVLYVPETVYRSLCTRDSILYSFYQRQYIVLYVPETVYHTLCTRDRILYSMYQYQRQYAVLYVNSVTYCNWFELLIDIYVVVTLRFAFSSADECTIQTKDNLSFVSFKLLLKWNYRLVIISQNLLSIFVHSVIHQFSSFSF